ncbi:MAG: bifunctional 5,10-methylenetetrahydrofolate dehydrogenase/5,10-methenyltetrahydrofolate cyclohydrolase [Coriobacteriia bacterium]|nr:bifunctional 5,10-methylenetetrahydrofolate dehydrogenase/5,10-methenyltetrahydrofolate cyclohydrolase [Coriobacteriia bacterium]
MAQMLHGAEVVQVMSTSILSKVEMLKARGVQPALAIVRAGERGDDIWYEAAATKRAEKLSVAVRPISLPEDTTTELLIQSIERLNADDLVHGVLLFCPLPKHINGKLVRNSLLPAKDVDGITDLSLAGVFTHSATGYAPCTAEACMEILRHYDIELKGKKVVVVGRSLVVGKPVAMLLLAEHATVTIAHSRTHDLPSVVREADVVIACVGCAHLIDASYLRPEQVVIDVGTNVAEDGSMVGDVNTEEALGVVRAVSPVPGGVGTVTTSVLIKQVVEAAAKSIQV